MKSGSVNKKGTLWRVAGLCRSGGYEIQRITEIGAPMKFTNEEDGSNGTHWISGANRSDFSEAPEIPTPKK